MARVTTPEVAGVSKLMSYGWSIYSAIQAGASVSEIWQAVRSASGTQPGEPIGATIFDMNYVAGLWRQIATSNAALSAAESTQAITSDMWAYAPWTLGGAAALAVPQYQIRYGAVFGEGDTATTLYRSWTLEGSIEGLTVGDVSNLAFASAQALEQGDLGTSPLTAENSAAIGAGSVALIPGSITILRV